jgi:hypothetical protein
MEVKGVLHSPGNNTQVLTTDLPFVSPFFDVCSHKLICKLLNGKIIEKYLVIIVCTHSCPLNTSGSAPTDSTKCRSKIVFKKLYLAGHV